MVARGGFASEPHCSLATIAGAELLQKLNLRPAGCCVWTRVLIPENAVPHTVASGIVFPYVSWKGRSESLHD